MKLLKKMTPMMLATMMLAPSVLLDQANARVERVLDGGRNGERGDRPSRLGPVRPGEIVAERDFGNWERRYIGNRSFKLIDDQEFAQVSAEATRQVKLLQGKDAALKSAQAKVAQARETKDSLDKEIGEISTAIVNALSEQKRLKDSLPQKRRAAAQAKTQRDVAKAGADSTAANLARIDGLIAEAQARLNTVKEQCEAAPAANCNALLTEARDKVAEARAPRQEANRLNNAAQKNLERKQAELEAKQKIVADTNQAIAQVTTQNEQRTATLETKRNELNQATAKLNTERQALRPIQEDYNNALSTHNQAMIRKNDLKEILITRILRINGIGANVGEEAGSIDGDYYAEYVGVPEGQRDGDRDGVSSGTSAGQNASYNRGLGQGEIEGNSAAEAQGQVDGNNLGTYQGHVAAATAAGESDGVDEAYRSDAANVGTQQGRTAGLERATKEGKRAGEAIGEQEAINVHEGGNLETTTIDGNFAGAFAPDIPEYEGFNCIEYRGRRYYRDDYSWRNQRDWRPDHQLCPNFRPLKHSELARTRRPILRKAFMDAYLVSYRANRRGQFLQSIANYYMNNYEAARAAAYADFSTREYPAFTEDGRVAGYNSAYNSRYPIVKEEARRVAFNSAQANPNTDTAEYRSTYAEVKDSAYSRRYEQIRSANFQRVENVTFEENIDEQTELFRKSRFATVDAIYKNNPVLKFISSEMKDGGINGVAKADGVFQTNEETLHNVTIMNYGDQAATNVTVSLNNGEQVKLPSIGGKKTVTVKGALKGQVDKRIGSRFESVLKAYSPLTAEARIQGRHYYATSSDRLNGGDKKTVNVAYPLSLSSLKTASQLLINQNNTLSVSLSNNSSRKYDGSLKIVLDVDSKTGIITKGFDDVSVLNKGTVTLNNARVNVKSESDVFTNLTFSARVMKQGVTLGVLNSAYTTMAKAPYTAKAGKPVFLADSDKNAGDLIEALAQVGGLAQASVIDLSLGRMNREVLANGVDKKMIVALDDLRGSTVKGVLTLLKNSEDSVMLFVDERNAGINVAINNSGVLKNAALLPVVLKENSELFNLRFTNPYLDGVKEMTVAAQTTPNGMVAAMETLSGFMKTNHELVAEAGSALNKRTATQTSPKLQNMIAMATAEILNINRAYKATNNDRYVDMVEDKNRLYGRVLDQSGKKVKNSTLSKNIAAFAMYQVIDHALDKFDPVDDQMDQDIELKVEDRLRDTIKGTGLFRLGRGLRDNLRKEEKALYNAMDATPFAQSPFRF